jgi:hypothetical protein
MSATVAGPDLDLWREYVRDFSNSRGAGGRLVASSKECLRALASRGARTPSEEAASADLARLIEAAGLPADSKPPAPSDLEAWARFAGARAASDRALGQLLARSTDPVAVARLGLDTPGADRAAALELAAALGPDGRQQLAGDLLELAGYSHGMTERARDILLTLPRPWLVAHLEGLARPLLARDGEEAYRAMFEVYRRVDPGLTRRLVDEAMAHPDEDVREAGADFRESLADHP